VSPAHAVLAATPVVRTGDHRLAVLSERAGFSERHLARVFLRELGITPARYVEQVRVEAARMLLETSDAPLDTIARRAGMSSTEAPGPGRPVAEHGEERLVLHQACPVGRAGDQERVDRTVELPERRSDAHPETGRADGVAPVR